jgi:probable rRNA maturation factor
MIEINNLTASSLDEKFLKKVAGTILKGESAVWRRKNKDLSIAFVGPTRIKELNKKYLKKNKNTDVLSFLYENGGELVICPREVRKNAKKFNSTFKKELTWVLIHGILHLLGYNHEKSKKETERMERKQEHYLEKIIK